MSELSPSFYTLYRQSRPSHHPDRSKLMEQHERFATACLAFTLEHDLNFRADFLKMICGYSGPLKAQEFKVSIEIADCGDLALTAKNVTFIIEAKIDAGLDDKQNPNKEKEFFDSGYGHGITNFYNGKRTYIILWQEEGVVANPRPEELWCVAKPWNQLLDRISRRGPIVDDLFKSLGSFHVRCFAILNPMTDKLKLASNAGYACQVHALLNDVADYLKEVVRLPCIKDCSDSDCIGWDVIRKKADSKWIKLIAPKAGNNDDPISWFGYAGGKMNVGFYCESSKVDAVRIALKKSSPGLGKVKVDVEYNYVWIESSSPARGDKEWFRKIYDQLSTHIGLHRQINP